MKKYIRRRALILCLVCTMILGLILCSIPNIYWIKYFFHPEKLFHLNIMDLTSYINSKNESDLKVLRNQRSIFMVESSGESQLSPLRACAVESAAKLNYQSTVILYLTTDNISIKNSWMSILKKLSNVQIVRLNVASFFANSPLEIWYFKRVWEKNPFMSQYVNEMLRFLILWKYGGVYLDLDTIDIKSLEDLSTGNSLARDGNGSFSTELMAFERNHPFLMEFMNEFEEKSEETEERCFGTQIVDELFRDRCGRVNDSVEMCGDILISPSLELYVIPKTKLLSTVNLTNSLTGGSWYANCPLMLGVNLMGNGN